MLGQVRGPPKGHAQVIDGLLKFKTTSEDGLLIWQPRHFHLDVNTGLLECQPTDAAIIGNVESYNLHNAKSVITWGEL